MHPIRFSARVLLIKDWQIIRLPIRVSKQLPSRGLVMVEANCKDFVSTIALEPDGYGSHWFKINEDLHLTSGELISLTILPTNQWIEPTLPEDIYQMLSAKNLSAQWETISIKARWEWIRWIRFTKNPSTRAKRINTMCSMLQEGKKRPCCFDHTRCTEVYLSKNGVLDYDFSNENSS